MFAFLGLANEPEAVEYGKRCDSKKGPGDPIKVSQHDRPVTDSVEKWAAELASDDDKLAIARDMTERLADDDLEAWGNPRDTLFAALTTAGHTTPPRRVVNAYTLQRRVMLALKKDIHERPHGRVLKKLRYYCDVLLRE
jgi:hypothetical protein